MAMVYLDRKFPHQANLDSKSLAFWSALKVAVDKLNLESETLPLLSRIQFLPISKHKVQVQYYITWNGQAFWCVAHVTFNYEHESRCWVAEDDPSDMLDAVMRRLEWDYEMGAMFEVICDSANTWYKTQAAEIDSNRKRVQF